MSGKDAALYADPMARQARQQQAITASDNSSRIGKLYLRASFGFFALLLTLQFSSKNRSART